MPKDILSKGQKQQGRGGGRTAQPNPWAKGLTLKYIQSRRRHCLGISDSRLYENKNNVELHTHARIN